MLLHSIAIAQSTMDYSIMAVDDGVVDSPVTQAPILERLNSPLFVWPHSLPHSSFPNQGGCNLPCVPYMMVWRMLNILFRSRFGFYFHLQK